MTYQELLDEFCKRRAEVMGSDFPKFQTDHKIETLAWAMQALLEKIRDEREGPR